ncbi:hypothetical protein OEA41_010612 [Lepraria neglecta]|uniref:Rhodopsin domain-containing protein n=1 Tax=Lepraria neglecta TaxID=209136 RepID=A0AAE0DFQ9_9LECA|nr:hypothetical protein OEA41_010612 [Lepraria neglecta]
MTFPAATGSLEDSIIGIFWLGAICVIASALRIFYTHAFLSITSTSSESWITYIISSNSLWLIVEANVSIIAACLPTLGGFLKGRLTAKSTNADTKYTSGSVRMLFQKGTGRGSVLISGEKRNTWVPLRNMNVETRVVNETGEEKVGCPERARGIMVETTFASESRAWT